MANSKSKKKLHKLASSTSHQEPTQVISESQQKGLTNSSSTGSPTTKLHTSFSSKAYKNDYMKKIIEKDSKEGTVKYRYCIGKNEFHTENTYDHLKIKEHKNNTPDDELEQLNNLIESLNEGHEERNQSKNLEIEKRGRAETKSYLKFLGFNMLKNLSFNQISDVEEYIKGVRAKNKDGFFKKFSFDKEDISKCVTEAFGMVLLEDLHKDLEENRFSFMIETSVISGQNYCTLVKYLKRKLLVVISFNKR